MDRYARLVKESILTRGTAELLAADLSFGELLASAASAIAEYTNAASVAFVVGEGAAAHVAYVQGDGGETDSTIPIAFGGRPVGAILLRARPGERYEPEDVAAIETLALQLGGRIHERLEHVADDEFRTLATTDALTGLRNRRAFDETLLQEWRRCARSGKPLALAMIDIDFFKRYNDAYGHVAGDACLRGVAGAIGGVSSRPCDLAARYGGEEFALVLPETDADGAFHVGEAICEAVRATHVAHEGSSLGYVTVSVGVCARIPDLDFEPQSLVVAADELLYEAKRAGRNRAAGEGNRFSAAPDAYAASGVRHNLPRFLTPILGRERAIAEISSRLEHERAVCVAGPGGIGKTRVAVQVALGLVDARRNGAWFVDLLPLRDPDLVAVTAAAAIGVKLPAEHTPLEGLTAVLATQELLLVLDNCEHVLDAAAALAGALTQACPGVRVLATSREPLGIAGESVYRLETLDDASAVALFAARARQADRRFVLTEQSAGIARELCRRLDGIALAIELAAACVHAVPVEQLLARLDDHFELLGSGTRNRARPNHQTLRALTAWSYDLLDAGDQHFLRQSAVFAGSWTIEAAGAICMDDAHGHDAPRRLTSLVDKSLVVPEIDAGEQRYRLLASTRQFAADRLSEAGEAGEAEAKHCLYYADLAQRLQASAGAGIEQSIAGAAKEWPNLQAALTRCLDGGGNADLGIAMTLALIGFWVEGGRHSDGTRWTERALVLAGDASPHRATLLYNAARLANSRGDFARLGQIGEALVALHRDGRDDPAGYARALNTLGAAKYNLGDASAARDVFERALAAYRVAGEPRGIATNLMNLGSVVSEFDRDTARARTLLLESLDIFRTLGLSLQLGMVLANLGAIAAHDGDYASGIDYDRQSIDVFGRLGNGTFASWPLVDLAACALELGDFPACLDALRDASAYLTTAPNAKYEANFADTAFCLACELGRHDLAVRIHGFVEQFRRDENVPRLPVDGVKYEERLARLRARIDAGSFERLRNDGAGLDFAAVCDLILLAQEGLAARPGQ